MGGVEDSCGVASFVRFVAVVTCRSRGHVGVVRGLLVYSGTSLLMGGGGHACAEEGLTEDVCFDLNKDCEILERWVMAFPILCLADLPDPALD